MTLHPLAGMPAPKELLIDVERLRQEFYARTPELADPGQRVAFGTSGHRGSSLRGSFNEHHLLAMTQAICDFRKAQGVGGPLFIGRDTHALSEPAFMIALEVLAANAVDVMIDSHDGYTPTPALSHAILTYNRGRESGLADGIVITPSHNPPEDGGFKYNPPHGGPAGTEATRAIEELANRALSNGLENVVRMGYEKARRAPTTHVYDYIARYVDDLDSVVDMDLVRSSKLKVGADPLGGAGVAYWSAIGERYAFDLEVVNDRVDPTFGFMTLDWDGKIRMDCSSPHAMAKLIALKDRFDIAFGNDTDHDRHGIVTRRGLMNPNHYLAAAIFYLFSNRPGWRSDAAIGKTVVSSSIIDRVATELGRTLVEVPVGFKWFVPGLLDGSLGFGSNGQGPSRALCRSHEQARRSGLRTRRRACHACTKGGASGAFARGRESDGARRRADRVDAHRCTRQWPAHRRFESRHEAGLVRGASLGHRGRVQTVRRELSRPRPLTAHSRRGAGARAKRTRVDRCLTRGQVSKPSARLSE